MTDNVTKVHVVNSFGAYAICTTIFISTLSLGSSLFKIEKAIQTLTDRIEVVYPMPDTTSDTTNIFKETE